MNTDETKLSTELNLALQIPYDERIKAMDLNVGYNDSFNIWELIIRYTGNIDEISRDIGFTYKELLNGYAIIEIRQELIEALTNNSDIIFIEKPKKVYTENINSLSIGGERRYGYIEGFVESCMEFSRQDNISLLGSGVLAAVIDSGIDITHPDFINKDGNTKIINLWDQSLADEAFDGIYTRDDINSYLINDGMVINSFDTSGHGTAVSGVIAACVPQADLLIIKLNPDAADAYPRTTSLMLAIDYAVRYARDNRLPLVINLSFGNNYGGHDGNSILEDYIDSLVNSTRLSIVTGTGNDGATARHTERIVEQGDIEYIEIIVPEYTSGINVQIWHSYSDDIEISLFTPDGDMIGPFNRYQEVMSYNLGAMDIQVINGYPTPINQNQDIYIALIPKEAYIYEGIWTVMLRGKNITNGTVNIWLPVAASTSTDIRFLRPVADVSLTIPSSANGAISVGAYNQNTFTYAAFSGRGYTVNGLVKPDISAPGVNIDVPVPNFGYTYVSGTSFAAPFVTSACVMLMQWGIIQGNDPYLYGEKIKAYLIKGARRLPGYEKWPNESLGYGALCVADSIPGV